MNLSEFLKEKEGNERFYELSEDKSYLQGIKDIEIAIQEYENYVENPMEYFIVRHGGAELWERVLKVIVQFEKEKGWDN